MYLIRVDAIEALEALTAEILFRKKESFPIFIQMTYFHSDYSTSAVQTLSQELYIVLNCCGSPSNKKFTTILLPTISIQALQKMNSIKLIVHDNSNKINI